jgi:uncharacterized membrane protein HdeD (DUF308 family)
MLNPMSSSPKLDQAMAEALARTWPIVLVSGLISLVVGMVILTVDWTIADLALVVSLLFIIRGTLQLAMRPLDGSDRAWNWVAGAFSIFVGIAFLAWPEPSLLTLAIFIGAWVVVAGVFDLGGGFSNRHEVKVWWVFVVVGAIELVLGLALLRRPGLTLELAISVAGIWSVVVGALQIIGSFELKHLPRLLTER